MTPSDNYNDIPPAKFPINSLRDSRFIVTTETPGYILIYWIYTYFYTNHLSLLTAVA